MVVFPNAKINIGLNILRRRPDNYHDIQTVMVPIGWRDILEIVPAKGLTTTLTVTGRQVDCPPEKNLVMKAYRALAERVELPDVDIFLHKIIPDGAGLGGGSADAAFTIKALNEMFQLGYDDKTLAEIAGEIGSDCSFFIYNKPMLATGRGTDLYRADIDLAGLYVAVVKPPVSVSTKEAYSGVTPEAADHSLLDAVEAAAPERWIAEGVKNDFEPSVFIRYPRLASIKRDLYEHGAIYAAMSGSGSALFGLFRSDKLADEAVKGFGDCDTFVGPL